MLFNSVIFLFFFLPIILTFYFIAPSKLKNVYLVGASFLFYFWGQGMYVLILFFSIISNYFFGLLISRKWKKENKNLRLTFLIFGIQSNLVVLIFYKYIWFLLRYLNPVLQFVNGGNIHVDNILLVAGISFYVFHGISYLVDIYRGRKPEKNIINTALYISLFPQLLAGPIIRYHTIAKEIINRKLNLVDISYGIQRFVIGLSKKTLIADKISPIVDAIFLSPAHAVPLEYAWLGIVCYALQIYFDFSGYSDMAIGLGRILGFHFLENFNYPYVSQSITEFWRRWHISLSSWFRDYVYIPLGGNKKGNARTYINLLTVFFFAGLWHGANWNFIFWGVWFGIFLILEKWKLLDILSRTWRPFRHMYALIVILIGWIFFRSSTLFDALNYIKSLFIISQQAHKISLTGILREDTILALCIGLIISLPIKNIIIFLSAKWYNLRFIKTFPFNCVVPVGYILYLLLLLLLVCIELTATTYHPFIYYQF